MSKAWQAFFAWWRPFWYGPPCEHGVYGHSYNERGEVIECNQCWARINAYVKRQIAEEKAYELRVAFAPAFERLEKRIAELERAAHHGR